MEPKPHEYYSVSGKWTFHNQFGKQFKVEQAVESRPNTKDGIIRYLASDLFEGVGPKTAKKIVDSFGLDTFRVLEEDPERLKILPKTAKKTIQKLIQNWKEKKSYHELAMFLSRHGLGPTQTQKVIRLYGSRAIDELSNDPYVLIDNIRGVGFLTADRIARSIGITLDHPKRIARATLYALGQAESAGHCYLERTQLLEKLSKLLQIPSDTLPLKLDPCLHDLRLQYHLLLEDTHLTNPKIYLTRLWQAEQSASIKIATLLTSNTAATLSKEDTHLRVVKWLASYSQQAKIELSHEQQESVLKAATNSVFVLTGGPGCGKTTTANTIIRLLKAMGKTVALAAPTGRAAQRMSEVSGFPAKTIHRLIEWSSSEQRFLKDETNPLTAEVVIIDESSMLDIQLASALLSALPMNAQVIFIGDVDQLPSVGAGNLLRDLLQSGVIPFTKLDKVFRQAESSKIIEVAHTINRGEEPEISNESLMDCQFLEAKSAEEIAVLLKHLTSSVLPKAGYDPVTDIQILSPMNRGPIGAIEINSQLQSLLNPYLGGRPSANRINQGDKVIQLVNNYELNVFNGDIGIVLTVKGGEDKALHIQFGDRLVKYDNEQANDLALAYAITIHKSQGSEFPVVIIPTSMSHYVMLQRNLIYTALTRARKLAIFIGDKKALAMAVRNEKSSIRQTGLTTKLLLALTASSKKANYDTHSS